jgi:peptidoglycan/LPS O-acetylase OafA/YrhL
MHTCDGQLAAPSTRVGVAERRTTRCKPEVVLEYRKDIDGLRAVAVLLVVMFHVHPRLITGGFVGVDIFFVISGFLITGLIGSGLRDRNFSLLNFYSRRIRRIFPALAIVLAVSMAVGWFVLFPDDYENLGKHVVGSAAFLANVTLWTDVGYFDAPAEFKPLLHVWSLGIEEQFYMLWPALLLLTRSWRRGSIVLACMVFAASFSWNVLLTGANPVAAFFFPTTRFWELMVGCILALSAPKGTLSWLAMRPRKGNTFAICDAASLLGAILVVAGALLVSGGRSFPGWWALLPAVGAALLIAAGPGALVNRQLLSRALVVQLGLISYPLYLWHWPILAFIRHCHVKEPPDLMRWGGILLAVVLALATYHFVEKPIRRGAPIAAKSIGAVLAVALIACSGAAVFANRGYAQRFPREIAVLFRDEDNVAKVFIGSGLCVRTAHNDRFEFTRDCARSLNTDYRIVVWGDSHGSNVTRGLVEIEQSRPNIQVVFFNTVGCPPIPSYTYTYRTNPNCPAANRVAIGKIERMKPDIVLLAGNWAQYDGGPHSQLVDEHSIEDTVNRLKSLGIKRIVGVGQFPLWDYSVPKLLARRYRDGRASLVAAAATSPVRDADYIEPRTFVSNQRVQQWFLSAGAEFVSPLSTLCNDTGCLLTVPGRFGPMERDQDHLTNAGSIWFVANTLQSLLAEE